MQGWVKKITRRTAFRSLSHRSPAVHCSFIPARKTDLPFFLAFLCLSPAADLITFYIYRSSRCYFGFETLVTDIGRLHYSEWEHWGPSHRTRALLLTLWRRNRGCVTLCDAADRVRACVCVSSNLPVLYTINCDLAQTVEGTVWRTSVRCGLSVLRLHFFSDCAVSDLGSERREREEEHFTQTPTFKDTNRLPQKHTRCTYACAQHARALTYTHKRRARRHAQLVWIGVLHIWLWFMIALQ